MLRAALFPALCFSALGAGNGDDAGTVAPAAGDRPLTLKTMSLRALVQSHGTTAAQLAMLPMRISSRGLEIDDGTNSAPGIFAAEDLVQLIQQVIEPEFWESDPAASLRLGDNLQLVVRAPAEVQEKIADLLGHLERDVVPSELLEVRLLAGGGGDTVAGDIAANELALDVAAADERIAARGLGRQVALALRDLAVVQGASGESHAFVIDWETEIAQGATVADPLVAHYDTGLQVRARSTRIEGGLLVNLLVRASETAAPTVTRRCTARSLINAKPVMVERLAAGEIEQPCLGFLGFAGSLFLPDGKAVWVPVTVETAFGPVSFCLDLRAKGGSGRTSCAIEPVARGGHSEPLRFELRRPLAATLGAVDVGRVGPTFFDDGWTTERSFEELFGATYGRLPECGSSSDELRERAYQAAADVLDSDVGSVNWIGESRMLTLLPPATAERVGSAIASAARVDAGFLVRIHLRADGEERGAFRVPAVIDHPFGLWSGVQTEVVRDWDVDVANECLACNPEIEGLVDGFALRLELTRNVRGDLLLDVNGKVHLLQGEPEHVELQDAATMGIDRVTARTLFVDELRTLPAKGGSVTLGGDLSLEIEVLPIGR